MHFAYFLSPLFEKMVLFVVFAIPAIILFAALGVILKNPRHWIVGKIIFEFKDYQRAVVYRFGKLHRVAGPGWIFIWPIIETYVKYDKRVEAIDVPPQEVITKDGVKLSIDSVFYIKVIDPVKTELEVEEDYKRALEEYVRGRIRNLVGTMEIQELYESIEDINKNLKVSVQELARKWGIDVVDVELQQITPPEEIVKAMAAEEVALLYKNAAVQEAEATKLRIRALEEAAGGLSQSTISYLYLKALKDVADGKSTKIIFPMELTKAAENLSKGLGGAASNGKIEQLIDTLIGKAK